MMAFVDPAALALVFGGAISLAIVQHGPRTARAALPWAESQVDPDAEAAAAERLIHAATAAVSHRGLFAAETLAPRHAFLRAALGEMADAHGRDAFVAAMARWQDRAAEPERASLRFWATIADTAPALGMIGTVVGMIGMAGTLGNSAAAGPALAVALTSTLYGLLLSACIAAPLAERAQARAEAGDRWRRRLTDAFAALVTRELAGVP